ncbi:MAG: IPT/TIG domain-containing protein, partial [Acidobacteriota bacterium]
MTVEGVRFLPESVIRINGQSRETEFISDTLLATRVDASELKVATELMISVYNPAPGGGQSSGVSLLVVNPTPRITSINPTSLAAGGPAVDLVVFGDGFLATSVVKFNGVDLPTTLVTGTQLTARISPSQLSGGGNQKITVFNPTPGGGISNIANLAVRNPAPSISQLSPALLTAVAVPTLLTVDGSGLVSNSVVRVNGQDRPTTWVSPARLTAQLTANDVIAGTTLSIAVFNPEPDGGLSNSLALPVSNPTPVLTQLSQQSTIAGSPAFRLTLTGTGFVPVSV